jgi:hypothetical protein
MPYSITRYDGSALSTVADGTIDQSTSLKLIGKNYAGYGEIQNENFVYLLENFSGQTAPAKPISGQIWFDSSSKKLKFFDGDSITGKWRTTGGAEIASTPPTGLTVGDFWFNTSTKQLFAWNGTDFTLVGPQAAPNAQITQMRSRSVLDDQGNSHAIIEGLTNGITVFTISNDAFTLGTGANSITGFDDIKRGITLVYTQSGTNGVTTGQHRFYGTATNAERLGGVLASSYVRNDQASDFSSLVRFSDLGYTVGNTPQFKVSILSGNRPIVENFVGRTIEFRTEDSGTKYPMTLSGTDLLPGGTGAGATSNGVNNIGSSSAKWSTVYANSFNGIATKADTLNVSGTYYSADLTATDNTIAVRDGNGDIFANHFRGIASQSFYADLAEKYLADAEYEVGTVVSVGGEKEVTASKYGDRALGAVSGKPAYMMNSELEGGTYVALKGRVPVKVVGAVRKGQRLVAANDGTAVAAVPHANDVFAIALESSDDTGVKLIEAVIL